MEKLTLGIIVASTRSGRVGIYIAKWVLDAAARHGKFDTKLLDLLEINLPFLDEPAHPTLQQYTKEHTKAWSATVDALDAVVMVTPEYNYSSPAPLINALDYLYKEWNYKPAAFVSYGGVSGGMRSVQMSKNLVSALSMMAIPDGVAIASVKKHLDEQNGFMPEEYHERSAAEMFDELHKWAVALKPMRA